MARLVARRPAHFVSARGGDAAQQLWTVPIAGGPSRLEAWARWHGHNCPVDIPPDGQLLATSDGKYLTDEIWLLRPASTSPTKR